MILTARLYIEGHELEGEGIPLLSCEYSFTQETDERGLPKSVVKGGIIKLSFNSMEDEELIWWMISAQSDKNGKIVFAGEEGEKIFKTLEFTDARCVYYHESFIRSADMTNEITISARELTVSGVRHTNKWTNY
jgi:hypothetical protein